MYSSDAREFYYVTDPSIHLTFARLNCGFFNKEHDACVCVKIEIETTGVVATA